MRIVEDEEFSAAFCRFLRTNVPDIDAARLLLRIAERPEIWWEMTQLRAQIGAEMTPAHAKAHLQRFRKSGLLRAAEDGRVRYAPADRELRRLVETLAKAYAERPVTLIRIIYAFRDPDVESFTEAVKLRRR